MVILIWTMAGCEARERIEAYWPDAYVEPEPEPEEFSIIWVSDTQTMVYSRPEYLERMGKWIESHREEMRTVCVLHTGDAVENGLNPEQGRLSPGLGANSRISRCSRSRGTTTSVGT